MDKATVKFKPVIGLMGGIGSGKSLVGRLMQAMGCAVIDSDDLARQALDQPEVKQQLRQWWGDPIILPDGNVDRQGVGRIVFDNPQELARLEKLVHPSVHARRHELRALYQADPKVRAIVEDCPLLLEKGLDSECDVIIFVHADLETRRRRLVAGRGWSETELDRREKNQLPLDIKAECADYVLDNSAGEAECLTQVRRVLFQILHDEKELPTH